MERASGIINSSSALCKVALVIHLFFWQLSYYYLLNLRLLTYTNGYLNILLVLVICLRFLIHEHRTSITHAALLIDGVGLLLDVIVLSDDGSHSSDNDWATNAWPAIVLLLTRPFTMLMLFRASNIEH